MKNELEINPRRAGCPVAPISATNRESAMSTEMFDLSTWLMMTNTRRMGAISHHRTAVRFSGAGLRPAKLTRSLVACMHRHLAVPARHEIEMEVELIQDPHDDMVHHLIERSGMVVESRHGRYDHDPHAR